MFCISAYEQNEMSCEVSGEQGVTTFYDICLTFLQKQKLSKQKIYTCEFLVKWVKPREEDRKSSIVMESEIKILSVLPATRRTTRSDGSSCKTARGWPFCHSSRARRSISMFNLLLSLKSCHALHCTLFVQMYSGVSSFVTIIFWSRDS